MFRVLLSAALLAAPIPIGEIFGDVRVGETYLAEAPVQLVCGPDTVKGKTDAAGSFRLASKASGRCVFSVTHEGKTSSVDVVVFDKPSRYRLVLELKDGVHVLKRV
ncbi:MAG: hypothetical protein ACT4P7_07690 [Gemmatimonadaceae bacterium]